MTEVDRCGVLIVAHGERGGGADNVSVERLATELLRRGVASEINFGFIKGTPGIPEAVKTLTAPRTIVYPLFLSDGYFLTTRLPQLLADARLAGSNRSVRVLSPFGSDPALSALIATKGSFTSQMAGYADCEINLILLAHGSSKSTASRRATERLANQLRERKQFSAVTPAFLEEAPTLVEVTAGLFGPTVVIGLFAGEGLHGAEDVPRLMAATGRSDIEFGGNVGTWPEIADIVALAITTAMRELTHVV